MKQSRRPWQVNNGGLIQIYNENCMELMSRYPDKHFNLAIIDPPYGHAMSGETYQGRNKTRFGGNFDKYEIQRSGGTWSKKYKVRQKNWDIAPGAEYFAELFRVADKIILWGGNYFDLPPSRNFIVWRKLTISESFSMAMVEYAWTNIWGNAKYFECPPQDKNRFHPTQKPKKLYNWLLANYAQPGWKILDTHLGSGTHALACIDNGFDLTASEINEYYYTQSIKMIKEYLMQDTLPLQGGGIDTTGYLFNQENFDG
jgi:site-specific DNA-methyltransferase (adenine-specific)